jgi:hypothetical protein
VLEICFEKLLQAPRPNGPIIPGFAQAPLLAYLI